MREIIVRIFDSNKSDDVVLTSSINNIRISKISFTAHSAQVSTQLIQETGRQKKVVYWTNRHRELPGNPKL